MTVTRSLRRLGEKRTQRLDRIQGAGVVRVFRFRGTFAHLQGLGIVHRDLKPDNVLILDDGSLRLPDFGLAKDLEWLAPSRRGQTSTGAVLGTIDDISPEQAAGVEVTARADVCALGVLLPELATGVRPRPDLSIASGLTLARWKPFRLLPKSLRAFLNKCTEITPYKRPADARAPLERLGGVAQEPDD